MNRRAFLAIAGLALAGCGADRTVSAEVAPAETSTAPVVSVSTTARAVVTTAPATTTTTAPADYAMGSTLVTQPRGHKITVYAYKAPVPSTNRFTQPKDGNVFATIDVQQCAGSGGDSLGPNRFDWELAMPDNTRMRAGLTIAEPQLASSPLGPNDCIRGFVSFEVPANAIPRYVVYNEVTSGAAKWRVT